MAGLGQEARALPTGTPGGLLPLVGAVQLLGRFDVEEPQEYGIRSVGAHLHPEAVAGLPPAGLPGRPHHVADRFLDRHRDHPTNLRLVTPQTAGLQRRPAIQSTTTRTNSLMTSACGRPPTGRPWAPSSTTCRVAGFRLGT